MRSVPFQHLITLLLLAGWYLATAGIGRLLLRCSALRFAPSGEVLFLSFGTGLIATGYLVFMLGCLQMLNPSILGPVLGLAGLLGLAGWCRPLPPGLAGPAAGLWVDRLSIWVLAPLLLSGLFLVLTPETGKDALIYHLAVPKRYLLAYGFQFIPGNIFAGYPLLAEMQYVIALFLQGDILAKAMHFALLATILLGIGHLSQTVLEGRGFRALSMLIFTSIPSVFIVSHSAYNDLFVALFTLAAVLTFLRWLRQGDRGWLILSALFAGAAAACKYTALLLPLMGCLGVLWHHHRRQSLSGLALREMALFATLAFIAGSPFYLKNWIVLGNPVYPFLYGLFGGRGWDADQARLYDLFVGELGMGRAITDYLLLPWNLSVRAELDSPRFDGILGPVFLLTLPFLVGRRPWGQAVGVLLSLSLASFLFWASSAQQIRYLIPLFPLLSVVTGAILARYRDRRPLFLLLTLFVAGSLVFNLYHITRDFLKIHPLPVIVGTESRDAFLTRLIPPYTMYRYVNEALPPGSRVFLIYVKNLTFLCRRDCYADAMFEAHTLQKVLSRSSSPREVRDALVQERFTHLLYDESYLLGEWSPLTDPQKKLYLAFQDLFVSIIHQLGPYRLGEIRRDP